MEQWPGGVLADVKGLWVAVAVRCYPPPLALLCRVKF
jgi:hypothetical protein